MVRYNFKAASRIANLTMLLLSSAMSVSCHSQEKLDEKNTRPAMVGGVQPSAEVLDYWMGRTSVVPNNPRWHRSSE